MIIDDKIMMLPPPPPYLSQSTTNHTLPAPLPILSTSGKPTLASLPAHILLQIIYNTFPLSDSPQHDTIPLLQRRVLFWLSTSLRLTSRQLYTASMHVLRSTYLESYQSLIRPPYTTDPFPLAESLTPGASGPPAYSSPSPSSPSASSPRTSPLKTTQRETPILDLYIALKVRQDVFSDDTSLHIEREEAYRDLFDVAQPRARLEDLVRVYGLREGVVYIPGYTKELYYRSLLRRRDTSESKVSVDETTPSSPSTPKPCKSTPSRWFHSLSLSKKSSAPSLPSTPTPPTPTPYTPLLFSHLTISFSPRKVGLIYNRSRTIAEVSRAATPAARKEETLERLAKALVGEVKLWLQGS
ncbi:hypothetical protein CPB83DRAFT_841511 [Crepidotus variabilis]|uniref:Uncharacterized protein n=1 Tax=Crepidotus variabilis TaxID=179855 RepID=A0A9P6ESG0_9AGAR|nr:hypothetical protein CPB83DRAFT_841511 [Crepidotus variabilis]